MTEKLNDLMKAHFVGDPGKFLALGISDKNDETLAKFIQMCEVIDHNAKLTNMLVRMELERDIPVVVPIDIAPKEDTNGQSGASTPSVDKEVEPDSDGADAPK